MVKEVDEIEPIELNAPATTFVSNGHSECGSITIVVNDREDDNLHLDPDDDEGSTCADDWQIKDVLQESWHCSAPTDDEASHSERRTEITQPTWLARVANLFPAAPAQPVSTAEHPPEHQQPRNLPGDKRGKRVGCNDTSDDTETQFPTPADETVLLPGCTCMSTSNPEKENKKHKIQKNRRMTMPGRWQTPANVRD